MFGYVTDEERDRWESSRARHKPGVSHAKTAAGAALQQLAELGGEIVHGRVRGMQHALAAEERRKQTTTTTGTRTRLIEETVDVTGRDTGTPISELIDEESDDEMELD